jgi:hypothetical protein
MHDHTCIIGFTLKVPDAAAWSRYMYKVRILRVRYFGTRLR